MTQTTIQSPSNLQEVNLASHYGAALFYGRQGWPVLPLKPQQKTPATQHGLLDATTDEATIKEWFAESEYNIGLRTGDVFDVLDIDGLDPSPAMDSFRLLAPPNYHHYGPISQTGKGYHLLFKASGTRNSAGKLPGLDIRGVNGYIVAPPSVHPLGHLYQWIRRETQLPEWPEWLDPLTRPPSKVPVDREQLEQQPILEVWALWENEHPLTRSGDRYHTTCIFHQDDTPSFVIYPDTNSFFCFGCHEWGDALNLSNYIRTGKLR